MREKMLANPLLPRSSECNTTALNSVKTVVNNFSFFNMSQTSKCEMLEQSLLLCEDLTNFFTLCQINLEAHSCARWFFGLNCSTCTDVLRLRGLLCLILHVDLVHSEVCLFTWLNSERYGETICSRGSGCFLKEVFFRLIALQVEKPWQTQSNRAGTSLECPQSFIWTLESWEGHGERRCL